MWSRYFLRIAPWASRKPLTVEVKSVLRSGGGAGVLRDLMGIAKVKISKINGQRKKILQHPYRVAFVDEIAQDQQASQCAAFPKADRNHASFRPLRRDPLNQKARAENSSTQPAD